MRQPFALLTLLVIVACNVGDAFSSNALLNKSTKQTSALQMTVLTYGSKKKDFKPGSKLSAACANLGVKPRYNCKKGKVEQFPSFLFSGLTFAH